MRQLVVPLIFFIVFYYTFWRVKAWANKPTAVRVGLAIACGVAAGIATLFVGWLFVTVFD